MPDWFPDWSGQACAIVASGPSAKSAGVDQLRGRLKVIALKESAYQLCLWADAAYGCDLGWWKHRKGLRGFSGIKIGWDPRIASYYPDVKTITIRDNGRQKYADDLLFDQTGEIGCGGNSGFQALNLAMQFGVNRILLIGVDVHGRAGAHWYGRNDWFKGNNPDGDNFLRWKKAFAEAAPVCRARGVDVVNASMISDLRCFRKKTVESSLAEWGL